MFTGIIEERGEVVAAEPSGEGLRLTIRGPLAVSDATQGDSIAVSGVCLTVVDQDADPALRAWVAEGFAVACVHRALPVPLPRRMSA
mgnify:CR=1 FL=1